MQKLGGGTREKKIALMGKDIDFISIISNEEIVCDVYFGTGNGSDFDLSLDQTGACDIKGTNGKNLHANVLSIKPEYPLVGLHGTVDTFNNWIIDLGVIWLDGKNPKCLYPDQNIHNELFEDAEDALNDLENSMLEKGFELEELMTFHSIMQDQQKQEEVKTQIAGSSDSEEIKGLIKDLAEMERFQ